MTIASALTRFRAFLFDAIRLDWFGLSLQKPVGLVVCMFFLSAFTQAQTAQFSGVLTTLGSGFNRVQGVTVDAKGNVFVADTLHNAVKEMLAVNGVIPASPTILTLGNGFSSPTGVAVNGSGNVFVADQNNNAVKEIPAGGGSVITLGSGFLHPYGVALDSSGNLFVSDAGHLSIKEILAVGGVIPASPTILTLATNHSFGGPYGLAVDQSGDVFVADDGNNEVDEIVAVGGSIPSSNPLVVPIGSGWSDPFSVAVDAGGNVFVADQSNNAVKKVLVGGYTTVITIGSFVDPVAVAVDRRGNVVLSEAQSGATHNRVLGFQPNSVNFGAALVGSSSSPITLPFTFDTGGTIGVPTVLTQGVPGLDFADAHTGTCTTNGTSHTYNPGDTCTVDVTFTPTASGARYGAVRISDTSSIPIATGLVYGIGLGGQVAFTPGSVTTVAGSGSSVPNGLGGPAVSAGLSSLIGVRTDVKGNVYIAESGANRILKVDATTNLVSSIAGIGTAGFAGDGGLATNAQLNYPDDLTIDGAGNLYISDTSNERIRKVDGATGIITTIAGTGAATATDTGDGGPATAATIYKPYTVIADGSGNLYVGDDHDLVRRIDGATGIITTYAGSTRGYSGDGGPATSAKFYSPGCFAFDNTGNLYIADEENGAIRKVDASTGIITTVAGNGQYGFGGDGGPATSATFSEAYGLALDSANNIYIADADNNRIRKVDASTGIVTTIAGTGVAAFAGDGATATSAEFFYPDGLAMDGVGNLYITDYGNNRIRKLTVGGANLAFTATAVGSTSSDSPQAVTVTNIGNAALTLPPPSTGLNPSISAGFSLGNGSTCPQLSSISSPATLAAGASCTELISFAPTVAGSIGGSLVLTDDALNAIGPNYATQTVTLSGTATAPPIVVSTSIPSETLTQGRAAPAFTPVTASGGTGALTYSVLPALPAGLTLSASTGSVSGTATAVSGATTYTVTVTDTNSTTANATFSLAVNGAVNALAAVPSTGLTLGRAATAFLPVTASGGTGALTYSVSPALPAGLSFSTSTGAVSGTATAVSGAATYTVTVTDANGAAATATFSLTVNSAVNALAAVPSTALTQGRAATAFTPVTASGGTGTLTYSVAPAFPAGLSFSSSTGTVSGTPTTSSGAATYTVTVTDANGATGTGTFSLTVNNAISATPAVSSTVLTQGHAAAAFASVTASGGTGTLTYSVAPALPAGLSFSSSTGTVSGTPTAVSAATTYTVTVTDANGATSTATFSLTVNSAISATPAVSSTVLTQGRAATAFTPVTASGGTGTLTYSVAPALPAGLSFASSTGTVSGTPTTSSGAATYTVTVTDANGAASTATFSLTVNSAVSATPAVSSTVLTQGRAATAFTPVTASGGTGTLTYSVAPALPAGLSFASSTGTVSGTPTTSSGAATYTVTVTDANGAASTATFSLTVNSAVSATPAVSSTVLTQGRAATAFTPVTASGGTGTLTYSVAPALPAGLSFASSTGTVSGTPTTSSGAATYTVTVTDANGATSTATFSVTVNSAVSATPAVSSTVLTQGRAAAAFAPVTASGGTGTLTYSVAPALPAGLSFSSSTDTVSGTPTAVSAATTYTVTVTDANGAAATATFSLTVNSATSVSTTTVVSSSTLTPTYGASVVLTATVFPAPVNAPAGTVSFYTGSTLLGIGTLGTGGVATLNTLLPLGQNAITAIYSGASGYAGSTSGALSVSDRTGTSVTFSASPTTQLYNNPIILTAQASSITAGAFTGTVSFLDGTTVLASVSIGSNGQASYSATTLADGSHSITAVYSGDSNFAPAASTGTSVAITVADLNLSLGGDQNKAVVPGAAVAYSFPLSPLVTPTFLYDVRLTATGLPAGATYTFSPAVIPAGSGNTPVTLTVQTAKSTAGLSVPTGSGNSSTRFPVLAFGLLLPLLGARRLRKRLQSLPRPLAMFVVAALALSAICGLSGCGGGGFFGATKTSGAYTITVTATSGSLVRTSTVQLTIQ